MIGKFIRFAKNPPPYLEVIYKTYIRQKNRLFSKYAPYSLLDDKYWIEYYFQKYFGYKLDLRNPKTFNEKLNWLKLYDRNPIYTELADKYLVRQFIRDRIGPAYLNELIGVYNTPEEINWSSLPDRFVIKTTHGSGSNIICEDKNKIQIDKVSTRLKIWLGENYYHKLREWPYKDITPRLICESYLSGEKSMGLLDYKVFCFNGEPQYIVVDFDRFTNHTRVFYDLEWNRQPFFHDMPLAKMDAPKPNKLDEIVDISKELSRDIPFSRVDMYYFNDRILFGEITFSPWGGFQKVNPENFDLIMGNMLTLPQKKRIIL